ncbi:hypothetical protein SAMN05518801_11041 [Novosphingobium sp. CF614]|nr:hypothetical protein SAMN05518801_11041 [Novosphingobium sp. CF614]
MAIFICSHSPSHRQRMEEICDIRNPRVLLMP